jgi:hypothetical protein
LKIFDIFDLANDHQAQVPVSLRGVWDVRETDGGAFAFFGEAFDGADQIIATYVVLEDAVATAVIYTSQGTATLEVEQAKFDGPFKTAIVPATEWLNRTVGAFMLRRDPETASPELASPLVELGRTMTAAQDALEAAAINLASERLAGGDPLEHADRLTQAASAFHTAKAAWLAFQAAECVAARSAVSQAA